MIPLDLEVTDMTPTGQDSHDDRRRGRCAGRHDSWRSFRFEFIVSGPSTLTQVGGLAPDVAVCVVGDLDRATAPTVRIEDLFGSVRGANVTVDLSAVTLIDSEGVRLLEEIARAVCRHDGEIVFVDALPAVERVIDLTGAGLELRRRDDLDESATIG